MGEVGPVACVSFVLGGACARILVSGSEFFPVDGQGCVWGICGQPACCCLGLCSCLAYSLGEAPSTGCCRQLSGAGSWIWMEAFVGVLTDNTA